jgi:hypothetical protein
MLTPEILKIAFSICILPLAAFSSRITQCYRYISILKRIKLTQCRCNQLHKQLLFLCYNPSNSLFNCSISRLSPSVSTIRIPSINSFRTLFSNPSQLIEMSLSIGNIRLVMSFIKEYTAAGYLQPKINFSLILMTANATRKIYAEPSTKKTSHTRNKAYY